jgi:hypothetical protein
MRAVATTKEKWFEAEVHRIAGEIELSPERDAAKAEAHFERALAVVDRLTTGCAIAITARAIISVRRQQNLRSRSAVAFVGIGKASYGAWPR